MTENEDDSKQHLGESIPTRSGQKTTFKKNDGRVEQKKNFASAPIFIERQSKVGALLLHGFTATPYEVRELAQYLAERQITVFAPLLAGHGTKPEDLAKTNILDWQKSVEEAYLFLKQKAEKVFVVGNSFGGNLAFHLAAKFNNPLSGVISLGTPIKVRWEKFLKLGLYTYGLFKKNQKKRHYDYQLVYGASTQVAYPVMPTSSVRNLFYFIRKITIPSLPKIFSPTLIIQSNQDYLVDPKSAQYLHEKLAALDKRILWMNGSTHPLTTDEKRRIIFEAVYKFIKEVGEI